MNDKRKNRWPLFYGIVLTAFTAYVALDAFVIPHSYITVPDAAAPQVTAQSQALLPDGESDTDTGAVENAADSSGASVIVTDSSYEDGRSSIAITQYREYDTDIYVADITLSDAGDLATALANHTYGKNVTAVTSAIADDCGAILAINGDYYGARTGYVIRNGVLYRSEAAGSDQEDLVIWADGSFSVVREGDVTAQALLDGGAAQVLSFGPGLVTDGTVAVSAGSEVGKSRASNPRTAIGVIEPLHYVFVVADGRTDESAGLSLLELADFMQSLGVQTAYNLDGGGSSTLVFNGAVINNPTSNGRKIQEREVSDIVLIG